MMSDKRSVILIIFLLIVSSVYAIELKSTETSLSLCPRDTQLFIDLVKNDGQSEQAFDVKVAGSAAPWATSIPTGFVLASSEERAIYTYLTPMSNTFPANYELDVKVSTLSDSKTAHHTLIVKDCHELKTSADLLKETCPNEKIKYDISITNLGEFQEVYNLRVEGQIAENVVLSESNIKLNPGEIKTINAYVNAPETDGEYEFTVIADSQQSPAVSSTKAKLIVKPCYQFDISSGSEFVEFCDHTKQVIPLTIKNIGTATNTYDLTVDGPLWASLDSKKISLNAKESKNVNLILTPDFGVSGNFEINVDSLPEKGDAKAKTTIKSNIKKCNSVFINILGEKDEICNSMTNNYNVLVKNDGEIAHNFRIEVNAPIWAKIDLDKPFTLDPGMEKTLTLTVSPGFSVEPSEEAISVKALASDEQAINSEDSITIKTISKLDCYMASVKAEKKQIEVNYDGSATVPIDIENKGRYKATYELSLTDTAASFVQLNPSIVEVEAGNSQVVYAYIAPGSQINPGSYKAIVSAKLKDSTILSSDSFDVAITGTKTKELVKESLWKRIKGKIVSAKNYFVGLLPKKEQTETNITEVSETAVITNVKGVEEETVSAPTNTDIEDIGAAIVSDIESIETQNQTTVQLVTEATTASVANLESIDLVPTINKMMAEADSFEIVIKNETHTIKLEAVSNDSIFLSIQSDLNYVLLATGQSKTVDVNNDEISDLKITFNGIKNGKADITFEQLDVKTPGMFSKLWNKIKSFFSIVKDYQNYIIIAIILIILIIVLIKTKFHKKAMDFFEEEVEEKDKGKNV